MRRKILFIATLILGSFTAKSQILWQKSLGGVNSDGAYSIVQTSDGGYIVAGSSSSNDGDVSGNHGNYDYWIVKLDDSGNIQWQKSLGGSDDDYANSIVQTTDGGYIVAGYSNSNDGNVSVNHGYSDYWIVKLDNSGNIQWQKSLGGNGHDYATSIVQTTDGGYIVAGYSSSQDGDVSGNHGDYDYWIVKLDASGDTVWTKSLGGSDKDVANSIIQASDGACIVAGYSWSADGDVSGNHNSDDYWIVKLDDSGNILWQKSLGGSFDDRANSIVQTTDGGYIVAGWSNSHDGDVSGTHGYADYWIVKLDDSGNIQWQKPLGGSSPDEARSIVQTPDGGYIVVGISESNDGDISGNHGYYDYWIVKLDVSGNSIWQKSLGGSNGEWGNSIIQTTDGGYIVAGWSLSNDGDVSGHHGSTDYADYWIVKLNYIITSKSPCYGTSTGTATVEWFDNDTPSFQWSNGDTTETADSLNEGWYYVTISYNNNSIVDSVFIGQNSEVVITANKHDVSCYDGNDGWISVSINGGTPPYTYLWSNGETTSSINNLTPDTYALTVTDALGCTSVDTVTISQPSEPLQDSLIFNRPSYCYDACNGSATIYPYGGTPPYTYLWSDSSTTQTIQLCSNRNYTVTVTDNNGCTVTDTVSYPIFHDSIQICVVTIDTATGKCLVVWERPDNEILNGFAVFKETGANYYNLIGTVNWEDMTQFLDTNSTPSAYAHSYKICMIDTCGNYTPLSYYHKTMYLTANQGANLNEVSLLWTHYEDESGNFQPLTYSIYRKSIPMNPFYEEIATIPANLTNYNDINPPVGFLYYLVLTPHDNCIPTSIDKAQGGPYNYSLSNIDDYEVQQIANSAKIFVPVSVYPNPVKNKLTVEIYNPQGYTHNIRIINANGKTVYETNTTSNKLEINRGDLPSGIYNITITGNNKVYNRKIIMK